MLVHADDMYAPAVRRHSAQAGSSAWESKQAEEVSKPEHAGATVAFLAVTAAYACPCKAAAL